MFHMPTSSPMMKTMLGFLSCAWAGATTPISAAAAISSDKPLWIKFRFILSLVFWFCYLICFQEKSGSLVNSRAAWNEAARGFHDRTVANLVPAHAPAAPGAPAHH